MPHKKLSNHDVDRKIALITSKIKRKSEYIEAFEKLIFECEICKSQWHETLNNFLKRKKYDDPCSYCSGRIRNKPTNNEIDKILKSRGITRLSDFTGARELMKFQCNKCLFVWEVSYNSVINHNSGCKECLYDKFRSSNEEIDLLLSNKNIAKLDNYVNNRHPMNFKCLICEHQWCTSTASIVGIMDTGCPKCAIEQTRLSNEEVDNRIFDRKIKRLEKYIDIATKINFQCLICENIWQTMPQCILNSNSGCPKCVNNERKLSVEKVDEILAARGMKRLNEYVLVGVPLKMQCIKCGYIRHTSMTSVHNNIINCQNCNNIGRTVSAIEIRWLDHLNVSQDYRQKTLKIGSKLFRVDAFDPTTNTVYEFWGDFWHGNPKIFKSTDIHSIKKVKFGDLYNETLDKIKMIKSANFNLVEIWEHEFRLIEKEKIRNESFDYSGEPCQGS